MGEGVAVVILPGMEHLYRQGEEVEEMMFGDRIVGQIVELDRKNYSIRTIHLSPDRSQYRRHLEMEKDHDQDQAHLHQHHERTNKLLEHQEDLMRQVEDSNSQIEVEK